jgi:hypothetical protein
MPWTAATMNMCIFGAVAVGPTIGGIQAGGGGWRPLFWGVAGLALMALIFAVLTFEDQPPQDRTAPWDWVAQSLAAVGCAATFFGASELTTHSIGSAVVAAPLGAGIALILLLVAFEYRIDRPLMPIHQLARTLPVVGVVIAIMAAAASVGLTAVTELALGSVATPTHIGLLFLPQFGGAIASAALFALLLRSRLIAPLAFAGLLVLVGSAAVLSGVTGGAPDAVVLAGAGMLGLAVGASVSPALFLAGFSAPSGQIQRVFALIELLRAVAAFTIAPILLHVAATAASTESAGIRLSIWICLGISAGGAVLAGAVFGLGRARLQRPHLEAWLDRGEPALPSPQLAAAIRNGTPSPLASRG